MKINTDSVWQINGDTYVNGKKLPEVPKKNKKRKNTVNQTIINNKVYCDGYEWTGNEWKRTLSALFHYLF